MLCLLPGPPVEFLLLRCLNLFTVESLFCFISFLYLDLYVLGDAALIKNRGLSCKPGICVS